MSAAAAQALPIVLLALVATAVVSFLLTPLAIRFADRIGAIDEPDDERRIHARPIPRTGGLAVAGAFLSVGLVIVGASAAFDLVRGLRALPQAEVWALFAGVAVGAALGYLDDRYQLRARWQLLGQLTLAALAVVAGVSIDNMVNPLGGFAIRFDGPVAMAVTTLWIVGMINSLNFVDGLDGLLSGVALIAVTTLGVISLLVQPVQPAVAVMCALLAGSLLGFLPYNFHPARIFIGTAGVFTVGYALAVLSVLGTAKVAVALLVLGVPIIDTFWIIIRRVASRRSPFDADRGHFHHRLLDLGLSHRGAVLLIYGLCSVLAIMSLVLSGRGQISAFLIIVILSGVVLYAVTRRAREALDRRSYPDDAEPELIADLRDAGSHMTGGEAAAGEGEGR
ncbi:MraY family glycosyltransferase [soil metagenome]